MNRKGVFIGVVGIVVLLAISFFVYVQKFAGSRQKSLSLPISTVEQLSIVTPQPTEKTSTASAEVATCSSQNLQAFLTTSPGAGNVYMTFTLKNISKFPCVVAGGNFISVTYDTTNIKNITTVHSGETQQQPFVLNSGQTLYSQAHYPNGPQCGSIGTLAAKVTFSYPLSSTDTAVFKTIDGNVEQDIPICASLADMTEIKIWNMSLQPITP